MTGLRPGGRVCGDHKDKGWPEAALWGVQSPSHPVLCPCLHPHSCSPPSGHQSGQWQDILWLNLSHLAESLEPLSSLFWPVAPSPSPLDLWFLSCPPRRLSRAAPVLLWLGIPSSPTLPRPLPRAPASTASSSCFHPHTPYLRTRPFPGPETHRPGAKGHTHWLHSLQKNVYRPRACLWDRNAVTPTFSP